MTSTDPYDLVIQVFTDIWPRYERVGFPNLTDAEKVIFCTWQFVCEVNNGGFRQYFTNPSGVFANETVDALEAVLMPYAASLLRKGIESKSLGIQSDFLAELTNDFFESAEDPYLRQAEFIMRHRSDFIAT